MSISKRCAMSPGRQVAVAVVVALCAAAPAASAATVPSKSPVQTGATTPEERGFNVPDQGSGRRNTTPVTPTRPGEQSEQAEARHAARRATPVATRSPARTATLRPRASLPRTGFDVLPLVWFGAFSLLAGFCFRYCVVASEKLRRSRP